MGGHGKKWAVVRGRDDGGVCVGVYELFECELMRRMESGGEKEWKNICFECEKV